MKIPPKKIGGRPIIKKALQGVLGLPSLPLKYPKALLSPVNRRIRQIALPASLSMFTITVVMVTDTLMIGRLGAKALAASGQGGVLFWVVASFYIGLSMGVQAIVARRFGEKKYRKAGQSLSTTLGFVVFSSLSLTISFWYLLPYIINWMAASEFYKETLVFTRYRYLGFVLYFCVFQMRAFFDGIGKSHIGMYSSLSIMLSNIILNLLFIYGWGGIFPAMGLKGAAIASSLSAVSGLCIMAYHLLQKKHQIYFQGKAEEPGKNVLAHVFRVALPSAIEQVLTNLSFVFFFAIAALLGTKETAASSVILNVMSISFMPGFACGVAAASLLGHSMARGQYRLAALFGWRSAHIAAVFMGLIGIFFIIAARPLLWVVGRDERIVEVGLVSLYVISVFQVFDAYHMVLAAALRSAGLYRFVLISYFIVSYLIFLPMSYLLAIPLGFGLEGLWFGLGLYVFFLGLIFGLAFYSGHWKKGVV